MNMAECDETVAVQRQVLRSLWLSIAVGYVWPLPVARLVQLFSPRSYSEFRRSRLGELGREAVG